MQQVLHDFQTNADLNISEEPDMLALWPFPVKYVALLQEEKNNLGILILHKGLDESIIEPFPVYEVLEPIVRHFTQGLMRLQSMEVIEKSIEESTAKLLAINEIGELLGQLDLDTILAKIMSLSLQMIQAEVGSLMIADEEQLHSRVEWGLDDEAVRGIAMRDGQSMVDWVHQNKIPLIVEKLSEDNRFEISLPSRKIESILSIPLYTSTKNLGVLNVVNTQSGESFSPENMATLQTLSGLASTAIENAILHKEAVEREVFREQLRIARRIWEDILPKKLPEMPGLSIYAESIPASIVGGDFYDFIPLSETRLGVVIADVSGKGIPAAMIMNMAKRIEELKTDQQKICEMAARTILKALDAKDKYTYGHSMRVTYFSIVLGKELGLSDREMYDLELSALFHDIGKINLPASILTRPGRLSDIEYDMVKTHSKLGYDMISRVEFPWPIADIVIQHHERIDGSGYPNGLKGKDIRLEAKILAVADVVEAMASHRPYRPALGINKALEEINDKKGRLYDSSVVDACNSVIKNKKFKFEVDFRPYL